MCKRRSLRILRLSDAGQQRGNRRTHIIPEQNRYRARQTQYARHAVCKRLLRKILQYRNRSGAALYDKRHKRTDKYAEYRNIRHFFDHIDKERAACQRLHDPSHRLDSQKQQTKRKYGLSDIFHFFRFCKIRHRKSCKNKQVYIIADFKRDDLRSHCRPYVCAKYNRYGLRQAHQSRAYEPDRHNCRRTAALQHCRR